MSNRSVSGLTHLIHGMAVAMSDGKAEADVKYVPVSNTPYVRVELGKGWDDLDGLRERMSMELAARGFRLVGGSTLIKRSENGDVHIEVAGPQYDPVRRVAALEFSVSGPYAVQQRMTVHPRDKGKERNAFEAAVRRAEDEDFLRGQGAASVVDALLRSAPFEIPREDRARISASADRSVARRIATAFGRQGLTSMEDLVEAADLSELLGREPPPPPGPR